MHTETRPKPSQHPVVQAIKSKLDERAMPIFRRTVGHVVSLASKVQSDIGELAQTILQDQSFSARLLSVANGAFYRNRSEPITSVTRAIVQVGYNTVRDVAVAAEFIDMAQQRLPPGIDLQHVLAKSLVAAHQARSLGATLGLPDADGLFTTSQIQNIGAFALAIYRPEDFKKIDALVRNDGLTYETAHEQVLDLTPAELCEGVMEICNLPHEMVPRAPNWSGASRWDLRERREAIVVTANQVVDILFAPITVETAGKLNELVERASRVFGLSAERIHALLAEGFQKACDLGKSLGLETEHFSPRLRDADAVLQHGVSPLIQRCAEVAQIVEEKAAAAAAVEPATGSVGSATLLVDFLKDLSSQVVEGSDFNTVVSCVLEGLHRAVGFDHAIVLLMVPGKPLAVGRYGLGPDAPALLSQFVVPTGEAKDLLAHVVAKRTCLRFSVDDPLPMPLPPGVLEAVRPSSFALGSLHLPARTVGLIWADRLSGPVEDGMWNSFQLFVMQANLALLRLSGTS